MLRKENIIIWEYYLDFCKNLNEQAKENYKNVYQHTKELIVKHKISKKPWWLPYEPIIEFETAKLAKELGFDWECSYFYNNHGNKKNPLLESIFIDDKNCSCSWDCDYSACDIGLDNFNNIKEYGNYIISAPSQSLLQKWLRDKHNIIVFVDFAYDTIKYAACVHTLEKRNVLDGFTMYKLYEQAFEEGLQEALKFLQENKLVNRNNE